MFKKPDTFSPTCTGCPSIIISERALRDMWYMVDIVNMEVGWLGTVTQEDSVLRIDEVFLLRQECHGATTELTAEGISELYEQLYLEDAAAGIDVTGPDSRVNKVRFWGHSHVNMGVTPSGQDDAQMEDFRANGCEWFIRGIFNKKGEVRFSVFYYYGPGFVFDNVAWSVDWSSDDTRRQEVESMIKEKVSRLHMVPKQKVADVWKGPVKLPTGQIRSPYSRGGYGL